VAEHNSEGNCYIAIHGKVYNAANFLSEHPGGKKVILKVAGQGKENIFNTEYYVV